MHESVVELNIAFQPPENIRELAIQESRRLQAWDSQIVLNHESCFPHITLYGSGFPKNRVAEAESALEDLVSRHGPVDLIPIRAAVVAAGFTFIYYEKTAKLLELHRRIIESLNPLREGALVEWDATHLEEASVDDRHNITTYGTRYIGDRYDPHMTLAKIQKESPDAVTDVDPARYAFSGRIIGLYRLGEFGTCRSLLNTWSL